MTRQSIARNTALTFILAILFLFLLVAPAAAATHTAYSDVPRNAWYYSAVDYVTKSGIMNGTGNNIFSPSRTMTRGMQATLLARLAGKNTTGGSTWYEKGMTWALTNGITTNADPHGIVTREEIVTMLHSYARLEGCDLSATSNLNEFADNYKVSFSAIPAMKWAVGTGIMNGKDGKRLDPTGHLTRAELSQLITNFCNKYPSAAKAATPPCSYCAKTDHTSAALCPKKAVVERGATGRLVIPSVGIDVATFNSYNQATANAPDSAATYYNDVELMVADHRNQEFATLRDCKAGDTAYFKTGDEIMEYVCAKIIKGYNLGKDLTDEKYVSIWRTNPGGITCYTCQGLDASKIWIVFFVPVK